MPHYNDVYISPQDFEICLHHGMRYDGFVEGLGYAYTSNFTIPPVHFQKYNPPGRVHDDQSFFQNGFVQYLDTSPEMRLMSVKYIHKVKTGDTLTLISFKYGIPIQSIKDANAGIDWEGERRGDRIFAGEELELPNEAKENHSENSKSEGFVSGNPFLGPTVARANFEQRLSAELYGGDNAQSQGVIDNSWDAIKHYYTGGGKPMTLGSNSVSTLMSTEKFQMKHQKIITGNTSASKGYFSVNMTWEGSHVFHIGNTYVDYSVSGNSVTYQLFSRDGFWDPDYIDEKTLGKLGVPFCIPDGSGPNLERGGTPYHYIPVTITIPLK